MLAGIFIQAGDKRLKASTEVRMKLGIAGFRKTVVAGGIGLLVLVALSLPAGAGVKPGDFITPDNASQVKDLVSPGVYYKVQQGMTMKIVPTDAHRLAASLQGRDRKIRVAGTTLEGSSQPHRLCCRPAVPAD